MDFVTVLFSKNLFWVSLLLLKSSEGIVSLSQYVLSVFTCPLFFFTNKTFVVCAIKTLAFLTLESISSFKYQTRD